VRRTGEEAAARRIAEAAGASSSAGPAAEGSPAPVLEARDLRVIRRGRTLVAVSDFKLAPGEVHVLLGANGAGKSTLLKALNGLELAQGTLVFGGREVCTNAARLGLRRRTAAVFQSPYLLQTSVRGNVESGLRLRGVARDVARRRAGEALDLLGIAHLADRKPVGLSGGEAQRVSIARALAVDPAVVFLDEPMAALDPPTRRALLADILEIFATASMAVVWVTHDREEALAVGDTVSFLECGRVVQTGSSLEVMAHPASMSFADFLGLDTYLEGAVMSTPEGVSALVLADGRSIACREAAEGPAVACLPPEDVVLFSSLPPERSASLRNIVQGKVQSVRPAGRLLHVVVAAGTLEIAAIVTPAAYEELDLAVGGPVVAAFKASAVHPIPRHERRQT